MLNETPDNIKRVVAFAIFTFLIVFAANKLVETYISYAQFKANAPERTIAISAEGKVEAVPDIATLNFSVVSQGKDAKTVQDNNSKKMNDVIGFVKGLGVSDKDIKTTNYNLQPQYNYNVKPAAPSVEPGVPYPIVGYTLTQTLTVKLRMLDKVGDVLQGVIDRGVNESGGVTFDIDDPDSLKAQARAQAFAKAREKAQALVSQSGVRVGKIVSITEGEGSVPYPVAYGMGGANFDRAAAPPPQVEPGSQEVRVSVNVVFELL